MTPNQNRTPWKGIILSLTIFIISLTQNAITYEDYDGVKSFSSIEMLVMGSTAILGGGLLEWIVWLANPLSLFSIIFSLKKNKNSKKTAYAAFLLSFSFLFWQNILVSESGREVTILKEHLGYWLWLLGITILTLTFVSQFKEIKSDPTH